MKTLSQLANEEIELNATPAHHKGCMHRRLDRMEWPERSRFIMPHGKPLELSAWDEERFTVPIRTVPAGQHIRTNTPFVTGFRKELMKQAA
jgi:hypothetical protein